MVVSLVLSALVCGEGRAGCCERRYRHAIGRAGDVVHSHPVTEFDGSRLSTMFATNADLESAFRLPPPFDANPNQFSDPFLVQNFERVSFQYPEIHVKRNELACVVPGETKGGLGQVVCSE